MFLIISNMDAKDILVFNVDRLCQEKGWKHFHLARKMGVKPESLSRSLNGLPRIDTIEKIAKALDVSIKSLFEDPVAIEGFVSVGGRKVQRFNSVKEFERIVKEPHPKLNFTLTSTEEDDTGDLPF